MQNIHENPSSFSRLSSVLDGFRAVFYLGDEFFRHGQAFCNVRINHIRSVFADEIQQYFLRLDEFQQVKERFLIGARGGGVVQGCLINNPLKIGFYRFYLTVAIHNS